MSVFGSPADVVEVVVDVVVEAGLVGASDDADGGAAVDVEGLPVTPGAAVEAPDPVDAGADGDPVEQDAVRVTARAAAVTAGRRRMGAECRSP